MARLRYLTGMFLRRQLKKLNKYPLPDILIYFVTNRCNSRCKGCFYWKELCEERQELTLDEIKKVSSSLGSVYYLWLSGGEPFLREDLSKVCEVFINQNNTRTIHIPTNGLLPYKIFKVVKRLLERNDKTFFNTTLSLDGFERTNDALRGDGSFKKILKTLSLLNELKEFSNFSIALNTVVSNKNYKEVYDFAKFVKSTLEIPHHRIFPIRGVLKDKRLRPVSQQEWALLRQRLEDSKAKSLPRITSLESRMVSSAHKILDQTVINALAGEKWPFKCMAGEVIGVLEPDGQVRLCELTQKVGSLRDVGYDFKKVWHSHSADRLRREIATGNCSRGCTHGCFLIPSILYNPFKLLI